MSITSIQTNTASIHSLRIADAIVRLVSGSKGAVAGLGEVSATNPQVGSGAIQPSAAGAVQAAGTPAQAPRAVLDTRA